MTDPTANFWTQLLQPAKAPTMPLFITLTKSHDGERVRIMTAHIISWQYFKGVTVVQSYYNGDDGDLYWKVTESPERIDRMVLGLGAAGGT